MANILNWSGKNCIPTKPRERAKDVITNLLLLLIIITISWLKRPGEC